MRTIVLVASLVVSAPALAQNASDHDLAVALFNHSDLAYKHGDFRGAVSDLEKAYSLEHEPILLYNLGRAYEGLGDLKRAIDAFDRYLKAKPDAEDRGAIEARLAMFRQELQLQEQPKVTIVVPPPPPPPAPHRRALGAGAIVVTSIGVAGVVAGGVLGALALGDNSSQNSSQTSQLDAQSAHNTGASLATGANIAFIAGGVIALAGVIWLIVDRATASTPRSASALPWVVRF
jgi:tetratricopeptide (TPR) repeat protein